MTILIAAGPVRAAPPPLDLSDADAALLVQTARRVTRAVLTDHPPPPVTYRPLSLRGRSVRCHATLRRYGQEVGAGESGDVDPLDGVTSAAASAARAALERVARTDETALRLALEVELIGPAEFLPFGFDAELHFQPELYACFAPGIDGVGVQIERRAGRALPSIILAAGYTPNLALQHAESDAGFTSNTKASRRGAIRYFRFRTIHLWQPDAFARPIRLTRGLTRVPPDAVAAAALDHAIAALADQVLRRRRRDAWLAYEYAPSVERFTDLNELFGQFESAWALGRFGGTVGSSVCRDAAERITAAAQSLVVPFESGLPARAVIATKEVAPLASTGMYLAAISAAPSPELTFEPRQVADAVRLVQREDGGFDKSFPPDPPIEGQHFAGAVALLGLLEHAGDRPDAEIDRCLRRAVRFYDRSFTASPDRRTAGWLTPALAAAYRRKPDPPVSDLLLRMCDWLVERQARAADALDADLDGAILDPGESTPDAGTARSAGALADGLWMARRLGDRPRVERYERALRRAVRFVMQLQFRADECYYVGGPADVVGAVRATLWDHRLRVNDSAAALWALTRARQELYDAPPAWRDPPSTSQPAH